ncbi:SIR2 family NAD-dependent protein deacylase [Nitrosophilus alvini]|uniref:SIR2 family NAD-dependent protein deacylase n=1 Tax=Nitrosophilus alvini TaxID=2714855 RepID=UPI00190D92AA|nr:Sir2 family NAD-dependent protein deacetylase [Nitrosophilus alvini]
MKKVMILSGAGLSQESGIKTFRDNNGLWEEYDVMDICSAEGWRKNRLLVTKFFNERREELKNKEPNPAHYMLAKLEQNFPDRIWHLTQNVDDLLERAGCKNIIHMHGTLKDLRCENCGFVWDIGYRAQREDEVCPKCESDSVRHNVVMFGEPAPAYRNIYRAVNDSRLFVAIGTSGRVIDIVSLAKEFGNSILVNPKREEYITVFGSHERNIDEYFTEFIQKKAGEACEELYEKIVKFLE